MTRNLDYTWVTCYLATPDFVSSCTYFSICVYSSTCTCTCTSSCTYFSIWDYFSTSPVNPAYLEKEHVSMATSSAPAATEVMMVTCDQVSHRPSNKGRIREG